MSAAPVEVAVFLEQLVGLDRPVVAKSVHDIHVGQKGDRSSGRVASGVAHPEVGGFALRLHQDVVLLEARIEKTSRQLFGHGGNFAVTGGSATANQIFEDFARQLLRGVG